MREDLKRSNFTRIAARKVQRVIDFVNHLQECSDRNRYEYDEDDVNYMFDEMFKALNESKAVFIKELRNEGNAKPEFKFKK